MTVIDVAARTSLDCAAALLAGTARAADVTTDVALLCLAASELLRQLDLDLDLDLDAAPPHPVQPGAARQTVTEALHHFGDLPLDVFGLPAVLDAASHARRALQLLS